MFVIGKKNEFVFFFSWGNKHSTWAAIGHAQDVHAMLKLLPCTRQHLSVNFYNSSSSDSVLRILYVGDQSLAKSFRILRLFPNFAPIP